MRLCASHYSLSLLPLKSDSPLVDLSYVLTVRGAGHLCLPCPPLEMLGH